MGRRRPGGFGMCLTELGHKFICLALLAGYLVACPLPSRAAQTSAVIIADPLAAEVRQFSKPSHPLASRSELVEYAKRAAEDHSLPTAFFLRLIRQESGFSRNCISPAGALGIAQFMPATARERGLKDPFDPKEALPKSAALLKDLRSEFGNLGLAAAAYNAGAKRVSNWLSGRSSLPSETRQYVKAITGWSADDWALSGRHAIPVFAIGSASRRSPKPREAWELAMIPLQLQDLLRYSASWRVSRASVPAMKHRAAYRHQPKSIKPIHEASLCPACITQRAY